MKILFFTGVWCMACKAFSPIVEDVATQNNIDFELVDVEENKGLVREHNIKSLPTTVLLQEKPSNVGKGRGRKRNWRKLLKR